MANLIKKALCFIGFHKWINIEKSYPNLKNGEMALYSNLHKCENCKKEERLSMGWAS